MLTFFVICATSFSSLVLLFLFGKRKSRNALLPPGPRGIPFLGNLLQMGTKPHLKFSEWANRFGKLYMVYLGDKPTLVVNDANLIRELFGMMASTGRLKTELMLMLPRGSFGIANAEGDVWVEQKRFCVRAMKDFGFGRNSYIEPRINSEADDLISWIENEMHKNGGIVHLKNALSKSVGNVLWSMITGKRIKTQQSKIVQYLGEWIKCINTAASSGLIFFSWIKYLAPRKSGYVEFKAACETLREYVEAKFEEHKNTRVSGEPPRDMIDAYIDKVENCKDPRSSFYGEDGWKHSFGSIVTLMLAGGDSTGYVVHWIIFYLTVFPAVQEKVHKEIDEVIGNKNLTQVADRAKMPYLEAVILEGLRLANVSPLGVTQELLENVNFRGYQLAKGTLLIANMYHVHHDKAVWGDPETFRPERFLEDSNKESLKDFIVAFQPGRRNCPAERIAKDMLFLFTVKLCQSYTFSVDPSVKDVREYLQPRSGLGLLPPELSVVVRSRK